MPKINSAGEPSYADHTGTVTNAVGEQFEVDPTRDLSGENKPVEQFDETPAPGLDGPITAIDDRNDERRDDEGEDAQSPRLVDHRKERASATAAKKSGTTPDATKK